jgi:small subunit ribosomal protein S17
VSDRAQRKVRTGVVVSDRMDKTVVIQVDGQRRHPMYGKTVRWTSKLKAHDEGNEAKVGDRVRVAETRPTSKTKRWRLVEIVERAR